jgi:glycosyltransferase involved in cell wall biosynthesis
MTLKVAFGTTLLDKGLLHDGIDGIGYYCKELLDQFSNNPESLNIKTFSYGVSRSFNNAKLLPSYPIYLSKVLLGFNFPSHANEFFKKVDLIHCTDQLTPINVDAPLVSTVMDTIPISHPHFIKSQSRFIKPFLWNKFTARSNHIITISEFSKKEIIRYMGVPEEKITTIPLGVNERYFTRLSENDIQSTLIKFKINKPFFLFIGSIQPRKNLAIVLEAHAKLPKTISKNFPIVIAGKLAWDDGSILPQIQKAVSDNRCIWLNYVSDFEKRCLLQSTISLVFISLYEGFGLPVLEAFASEAPVIASNSSSIPEIAGDAALLVNPSNINEISNAMESLIDNQNLRVSLCCAGKIRVRNYSWIRNAEATYSLYKKLI